MNATENALDEVLFLEDDEEQRELGEKLLEMKTGTSIDPYGTIQEVENWDYDLTVSDYSGVDIDTVYENSDNVIVFTGFPEGDIEMPEHARYVGKGGGYDELAKEILNQL